MVKCCKLLNITVKATIWTAMLSGLIGTVLHTLSIIRTRDVERRLMYFTFYIQKVNNEKIDLLFVPPSKVDFHIDEYHIMSQTDIAEMFAELDPETYGNISHHSVREYEDVMTIADTFRTYMYRDYSSFLNMEIGKMYQVNIRRTDL